MELFKTYFSKDDLEQLAGTIAEAERGCSGEIRVVIRKRRSWLDRRQSLFDLALKEFFAAGMDKTRDKTGILIFVLLAEHKFQIVADEGINARVERDRWNAIAEMLSEHFRGGQYLPGMQKAVMEIGRTLSEHFPRKADDTDELSNDIIMR